MQPYSSLPEKPGVYLFKDKKNKVIYVGKAKSLKKRVSSYFADGRPHDAKTIKLLENIHSVDHIVVASEIEAFLLEANLIKKYQPFYNINFKDDKFYPYVETKKGKQPYLIITRKKNDPKAKYYGPYIEAGSLKTVLKLLRRIFPFQSVKNHPKRTCLYFHLGLCPCLLTHPENKERTLRNIKCLENFLKGKKEKVISTLKQEQRMYVKSEEFEKAKEIQDKIDKIIIITGESYSPFRYIEKPDYYNERIQNELKSLQLILETHLTTYNGRGLELNRLNRIECYDISNLSGREATGSMVVFINGDAAKKYYRRFKIRFKQTPDDYTMIKETLSRRLKHSEWELPNLVVIDGGKGQVSSALEILAKNNVNVPVIGLAKREETIVMPVKNFNRTEFLEVKLPKSTPGVNLLRRLRDEAHRFAITYHRLLRKKQAFN